ncbi:MAG: glycoside hydrolase family 5 protein [Chitinophagaceae bacterium]
MKTLITFVAALFLLAINAKAQYTPLPFGVSLCGAEFGTESLPGLYNKHYVYPDKAEIEYFAKKGISVMQLPFRWERIQRKLGGALDVQELTYMKKFLSDCTNSGVMVVLNMHNFARYKINGIEYIIGSPEVPLAAFKDVWKKIATALNGFQNIYAFDIMNEPHDMGNYPWFYAAQQAINGIREVNPSIYIMIEGDRYSNAPTWAEHSDNLKNLKDPADNLIYNAHCYFDTDLSGRYAYSYDEMNIHEQTGVEKIKPFINWLKANGKKGFVGEFGIPKNDKRWLPVLDNFLRYLTANNISGSYWAAGPWWKSYPLSLHPIAGNDQPQMGIYAKYLYKAENNPATAIAANTTPVYKATTNTLNTRR